MAEVPGAGALIVGGSIAGARTAVALRRQGWTDAITLVGAETHWPPIDRPPLSKAVLMGEVTPDEVRLRLPDVDVRLLLGRRATTLDVAEQQVVLDDDSIVTFEHLVIATGATPRRLGPDRPWMHVLRTAEEATRLAEAIAGASSVVVIGGGFIGCEVASACRELGCETHVVEATPAPLPALGPVIGQAHATRMRAAGVDLHLGVAVRAIDEVDGRPRVHLDDGTDVDADVVVVGIGVRPDTGWLEGSGLTIDDGVVCDDACVAEGGAGRVFAAGDVARWAHPAYGSVRIEHWTNAGEQATHVARTIISGERQPFAPVPYVWTDQFGSKMQLVGRPSAGDDLVVEEGDPTAGPFVATYRNRGLPTAALCCDSPRALGPWTQAVTDGCRELATLSRR